MAKVTSTVFAKPRKQKTGRNYAPTGGKGYKIRHDKPGKGNPTGRSGVRDSASDEAVG